MKHILSTLSLGFLLLSAPAFADPSLKDNMGQLGDLYKLISSTLTDPAKAAPNAENAKKMAVILKAVLLQVPDTISELPPEQRDSALASYKKLINDEIAHANDLAAVFSKSDTRTAANILNDINLTKRDGHNKFKRN